MKIHIEQISKLDYLIAFSGILFVHAVVKKSATLIMEINPILSLFLFQTF